jgi:spore germination protein YaaH
MMYTVKAGDSLWAIASQFGVSIQDIVAANPRIDPHRIYVGQSIWIPSAKSPAASGSAGDGAWHERVSGLERTIGQFEEIVGHHRRQIADLQSRIAAIEQQPK